jgi:hypothetical protein
MFPPLRWIAIRASEVKMMVGDNIIVIYQLDIQKMLTRHRVA